ncbi:glycosyltransferase family protein [Elioraea thermophila]|uniref:glycosyltransferase family protein n=1 Tax=Elioraea thermophila TaxID=2185104 RepID=UPI0038B7FF52
MAAGCLVLASDTAPVREVIEPGANGMVADLRDPGALAACAAELLAAGDALDAVRRAARRTILARFRRDRALARWSALIERVATQSTPAAASAAREEGARRAASSIPIAATMRGRERCQSGRSNP